MLSVTCSLCTDREKVIGIERDTWCIYINKAEEEKVVVAES